VIILHYLLLQRYCHQHERRASLDDPQGPIRDNATHVKKGVVKDGTVFFNLNARRMAIRLMQNRDNASTTRYASPDGHCWVIDASIRLSRPSSWKCRREACDRHEVTILCGLFWFIRRDIGTFICRQFSLLLPYFNCDPDKFKGWWMRFKASANIENFGPAILKNKRGWTAYRWKYRCLVG
jgi:hypothetical protein